MLEKYYKYKLDYRKYLTLIKCGNFYECISDDAFIMHKIFNYKLKKFSNTFKVGFPLIAIDSVIERLKKERINYVIVDGDNVIKNEFDNNSYLNYNFNDKNIFYNYLRIDRIIKYLNNNITLDIDDKLKQIEDIIYEK